MKVQGKLDYSQIDVKRFYLPGLEVVSSCPHCKAENVVSMEEHYPYNIQEDGSASLSFLCSSCEEAVDATVVLEITLKPV